MLETKEVFKGYTLCDMFEVYQMYIPEGSSDKARSDKGAAIFASREYKFKFRG